MRGETSSHRPAPNRAKNNKRAYKSLSRAPNAIETSGDGGDKRVSALLFPPGCGEFFETAAVGG